MEVKKSGENMEIDPIQVLKVLWKKAWVIVLASVIFGGIAFGYTKLLVIPTYQSQIVMYVNNKNQFELSQDSISQGDLSAAQHLVDTYTVFLESRTTLEEVLEQTKLSYSYEQIKRMLSAHSVNDTGAFCVEVTGKNAEELALIANTIGKVLPEKIVNFIPGSSVKVVDYAVVPQHPISPNRIQNTVLGAMLGALLSSASILVAHLMDHQIHDCDYLTEHYDIPVLAVIPDLQSNLQSKYGYYQQDKRNKSEPGDRNV